MDKRVYVDPSLVVNTCHTAIPEHFRDEYFTHGKALYKCGVDFALLYCIRMLCRWLTRA